VVQSRVGKNEVREDKTENMVLLQLLQKYMPGVYDLRGMRDKLRSNTIVMATKWAINNICKPLTTAELRGEPLVHSYARFAKVYSCTRPSTGQFYITLIGEEDGRSLSGYSFWRIVMTKDKEMAMEHYYSTLREWEEKGVKYRTSYFTYFTT